MKKIRLVFWVVTILLLVLSTIPASAASASTTEKIKQLIPYALDPEKGKMVEGRPMVFLDKVEKVKEGVERRLYFVITIAPTPQGFTVVEVFCSEELWETKNVNGKTTTLVTQKMSVNGENFTDAFVIEDAEGVIIKKGSKPADPVRGEIWLNEFLDEMLKEFGDSTPTPIDSEKTI